MSRPGRAADVHRSSAANAPNRLLAPTRPITVVPRPEDASPGCAVARAERPDGTRGYWGDFLLYGAAPTDETVGDMAARAVVSAAPSAVDGFRVDTTFGDDGSTEASAALRSGSTVALPEGE